MASHGRGARPIGTNREGHRGLPEDRRPLRSSKVFSSARWRFTRTSSSCRPDFVDARVKLASVFRQLGLLSDAVQQLEQGAALYQEEQPLAPRRWTPSNRLSRSTPTSPRPRHSLLRLSLQSWARSKKPLSSSARRPTLLKGARGAHRRVPAGWPSDFCTTSPRTTPCPRRWPPKYLDHNNARAALARLKSVFEANQRDPEVLDLRPAPSISWGSPTRACRS